MVELMQSINAADRIISCYDVTNSQAYDSDYYMVVLDKVTKKTFYLYFEDMDDMFYIYDILRKEV